MAEEEGPLQGSIVTLDMEMEMETTFGPLTVWDLDQLRMIKK